MNALLIHQAFAAHADPGGTRHYELARHCAAQGITWTIITSPVDYLSGKKKELPAAAEEKGIRVIRAGMPATLHANFLLRVFAFIAYMVSSFWRGVRVKKIDLVMGTTPPIFQAASAALVAAIRRKPFLLEVRDLWPEFAVDMGVLKHPVLIYFSRRLERWLYRRADHIVVNSPAYRPYLREKGVPDEKITLIPNGVDAAMFTPEAPWPPAFPEPDRKRYHVAYTGALGPANDIDSLIAAAERLTADPGIHFWLVGDGKERTRLERLVQEKKLHNVTFTGAVPKTAMPGILQRMDLCVAILKNIPMFKTTYPNKVFDYMAAGKPILLAIDGVIREVIEDAECGLFTPPGDAEALVLAVLDFKDNPETGRRMGKQARAWVSEHFDRGRQGDLFCRLLREMAG